MTGKRTMAAALAAGLLAGTAGAANAQSSIKVGVLLPFSGVFGGLGKDQAAALEMGFDDLGREVGGRTIELVKADTESKPAAGLAQVKKLILRDKVDVVVGIISSAVAGAVRDYVHGSKTPLIITNAGNDALTGEKCSPWIVRTSFSNSQINRDMGPWMAAQGYKSAFLMAFDYAAGHQMMDAFKAGFTGAGGAIAGEAYPPLGETKDFGPLPREGQGRRSGRGLRVLRRRARHQVHEGMGRLRHEGRGAARGRRLAQLRALREEAGRRRGGGPWARSTTTRRSTLPRTRRSRRSSGRSTGATHPSSGSPRTTPSASSSTR